MVGAKIFVYFDSNLREMNNLHMWVIRGIVDIVLGYNYF